MKTALYIIGLLLVCQVAVALDFSGNTLISSTTNFKGNGTIVFPDKTDISNGFNITAKFKLDSVKHEYIIWSKDRYLLQVTVDGYIQTGIWNKTGWMPLVTYPKLVITNTWYDVFVSYNNTVMTMVVNNYTRAKGFIYSVGNKDTLTYIGNRDDWGRALQGTIQYLDVSPYIKNNSYVNVSVNTTTVRKNGVYHSANETYTLWKQLADSTPLGSYEVIGKSLQGKDIILYKFGNPNGGKVMIDSRGHGPEDCGGEIGYTFVKNLIATNSSILRENYVMFIPVVNVDTTSRQNKRRNYTLNNGTVILVPYGVDLNRNGISGFGGSGSGNTSNNYEYRGLYGGSEPETQALAYAEQKYKPDIYVNTHCGMNMLHYCTNDNITKAIISQLQNTAPATTKKYPPGQQCTGGYIMTQAKSYGANSWIFEIATWDEVNNRTLEQYNDKFYPLAAPVYEAMCNAVRKV